MLSTTALMQPLGKIEKSAIIQVHGWIMLKGIDEGKYRLKNNQDGTYTFYKPRGRRWSKRFYISSVDLWIRDPKGDLNWVEIIEKL